MIVEPLPHPIDVTKRNKIRDPLPAKALRNIEWALAGLAGV